MIFNSTFIEGLFTIQPEPIKDSRGWFARTFCKEEFKQIGHDAEWVQMNHSYTENAGTLRGMHFQLPPFEEIKLIRCVRGKVFDVAIDVRTGSKTFLKWFGTELSEENQTMIYIPRGFAHGFLTMEAGCELIYLHSAFYKPGFEGAIRYDDPQVKIDWPSEIKEMSEKDAGHKYLEINYKGIQL